MNKLALPPFEPISCGCNGNKKVYGTICSWKTHVKGQRHLSYEQEYKVKIQQQLLTTRDNEILRLGLVIREKEADIIKIRKIANGIISELKRELTQIDHLSSTGLEPTTTREGQDSAALPAELRNP
ncbi:MAG: hypothetical protein CMM25_05395 [Rhodospirillaceae bacterium]|nr:hypothetical protein [Rhodospirillaceae bacterium]|tara:strand:- start:528 stop:905 length:378 start_codon:yes stop_codon:yes gene_type:complete